MNIAVTTQAGEGFPRRAFKVLDVRRMIDAGVLREDEKFELIQGEFIMMAAKGFSHEVVKSELNLAIARVLADDSKLVVECTLQLDDDVLVEPDLAIMSRSAFKQSPEGFVRPNGIQLVIEVAASRLAYDQGLKARLYARHGIREFWVIDANERKAWVHTRPSGDTWSSIVERGPTEALTTPALPGFSIRLGDIE